MSKRAEQRALEAYPVRTYRKDQGEPEYSSDYNANDRYRFKEGYEQAEKDLAMSYPLPEDTVLFQKGVEEGRRLEKDDLALTWDDVKTIFKIADNYESELNKPKYLTQDYCQEILNRFNAQRKK